MKFTVPFSGWRTVYCRQENAVNTRVCVIGHYLRALGVDLAHDVPPSKFREMVPPVAMWLCSRSDGYLGSAEYFAIGKLNDVRGGPNIPEIKELFAKHNVEVEFEGFPDEGQVPNLPTPDQSF